MEDEHKHTWLTSMPMTRKEKADRFEEIISEDGEPGMEELLYRVCKCGVVRYTYIKWKSDKTYASYLMAKHRKGRKL